MCGLADFLRSRRRPVVVIVIVVATAVTRRSRSHQPICRRARVARRVVVHLLPVRVEVPRVLPKLLACTWPVVVACDLFP